jgi:GxxExxY protein
MNAGGRGLPVIASEEKVIGASGQVIAAAIEVHQVVGPGLLESIYEECLCRELSLRRVPFERQVEVPVRYKNVDLGTRHRLDILVEGFLVVELKSVEKLLPIHHAQVLTELRLCNLPLGLLINFNVPALKAGIKRVVNHSGFDLKRVLPHRPSHQ